MNKYIPEDVINKLFNDRTTRIQATRQDLLVFFSFYFQKFIKYEIAPFQNEMLQILQNEQNKTIVFTAFRNSGKTTFCSLVLPIWSIIGVHQKKDILIVSQTEQKAERISTNIRRQLTSNTTLLQDHGIFYEGNNEWNKRTLVLAKYGARITVISIGESIRGVLHDEIRTDLVIYDDIEDVQSANTPEGRDKLQDIIGSEFIPLGTKDTRHVFIGNLVHQDSMMSRHKKRILSGEMTGIYREYPLVTDEGIIMWPDQFPNIQAIEELRKQQISNEYFQREYLLKIIPVGNRLILPENIHRYDESELASRADFQMYLILIDPAVSGEHTIKTDKTGIIVIRVYGQGDKMKLYISPNPINARLEWPEIINEVKRIITSFGPAPTYKILVEGGSTQKGLTQMLKYDGLNAEEVSPQGNDKRTRVSMLKPWLPHKVVFPQKGTEELEFELIGFGTERYDDLVDALTLIVFALPEIEKHLSNNPILVKCNIREFITRKMNRIVGDSDEEDFDNDAFMRNKRKHTWSTILQL